jgi:hypothetical protein
LSAVAKAHISMGILSKVGSSALKGKQEK